MVLMGNSNFSPSFPFIHLLVFIKRYFLRKREKKKKKRNKQQNEPVNNLIIISILPSLAVHQPAILVIINILPPHEYSNPKIIVRSDQRSVISICNPVFGPFGADNRVDIITSKLQKISTEIVVVKISAIILWSWCLNNAN